MSVTLPASILRAYDIRGVAGDTLTEDVARQVGRAFGTLVSRAGGKRVAVGRDGRLSSPALAAALVDGLRASGVDVVAIEPGPSPMLYFTVHDMALDGGVMVTGSHNPADHNGFKFMLGTRPFYGDAVQSLGQLVAEQDVTSGAGGLEQVQVMDIYVDALLRQFTADDWTLAWDAGNGAAGPVLDKLIPRLPGDHHLLFTEMDGRFPNHHPDPTVEDNLADLKKAVAQHSCTAGFGFDGDGDRLGAVDGGGRVVWGDQILALLAADVLRDHPGAPIIADVKASQMLFNRVAALGGEPVMGRTGHSLIKQQMLDRQAPLAGEMSGHIFFGAPWYGFDDGIYAALRLWQACSRAGMSLAQAVDTLPVMVNTPEIRLPLPEDQKPLVMQALKAGLQGVKDRQVNDLDGVRVTGPDGWWLARPSNTQAVLVVRAEAGSRSGLDEILAEMSQYLENAGISPFDLSAALQNKK